MARTAPPACGRGARLASLLASRSGVGLRGAGYTPRAWLTISPARRGISFSGRS